MKAEEFHALVKAQPIPPECKEMNPEYFFADPHDEEERYGASERAIAVSACRRCPIMRACASYAMDNEIEYGVFGGMLPQERKAYIAKKESGIREQERKFGKL